MSEPESLLSRIHRARLAEAGPLLPLSDEDANYIISAAQEIPISAIQFVTGGTPQAGELWRVGKSEALLAWVRKVFDDGMVDVIPITLDVELADEGTLLIPEDATPLGVELAAMTYVRTHLPKEVFLNFICALDIGAEIEEVLSATRDGRPAEGVEVGLPITDSQDQRLEYRAALWDVLGHLLPSEASQEGSS